MAMTGAGSHDPVDDRQIDPEHELDDESHGAVDRRDLKRAKDRQRAQGKQHSVSVGAHASPQLHGANSTNGRVCVCVVW